MQIAIVKGAISDRGYRICRLKGLQALHPLFCELDFCNDLLPLLSFCDYNQLKETELRDISLLPSHHWHYDVLNLLEI